MTEQAPRLHLRLTDAREAAEKWYRISRSLAEALDAEVDLRHGSRVDSDFVIAQTAYILSIARHEGLL